VELSNPGEVSYDGEIRNSEFSAPLDARSGAHQLAAGPHTFRASILRSSIDGVVTVVRAPATLTSDPVADPQVSIEDQALGLYYTTPPGTSSQSSFVAPGLASLGEPVAPAPRPIGARCGPPQVTDVSEDVLPAALDVSNAWFDADGANIYASIEVRDLPANAPQGRHSWTLHWRYEHSASFARAVVDANGQWSFYWGTRPVQGDVKLGPNGVMRVWVPRDKMETLGAEGGIQDGELLRQTSAHSYMEGAVTDLSAAVEVDAAPDGSDTVHGSGGDYEVGQACDDIEPTPTVTPTPTTTTDVAFTERSAESGQYSDETLFEARLTDSAGDPISGQELIFELRGTEGMRSLTARGHDADARGETRPPPAHRPLCGR
jgi:hypothetical protein